MAPDDGSAGRRLALLVATATYADPGLAACAPRRLRAYEVVVPSRSSSSPPVTEASAAVAAAIVDLS
jgi:hypothetical protein